MIKAEVLQGDGAGVSKGFPDKRFDLIVISPPCADRRRRAHGGVLPERYVDGFLERSAEFLRVLAPTGSKRSRAASGNLRAGADPLPEKAAWLWTEEYLRHEKNRRPGKRLNRFRGTRERRWHFTESHRFKMNQEAAMAPMGRWAQTRLRSLGASDVMRHEGRVGGGFGKNVAHRLDRKIAYPTRVLHRATERGDKDRRVAFAPALLERFITLFPDEGDWVLGPSAGSGTTLEVAESLRRNSVGVVCVEQYLRERASEIARGIRRDAVGDGDCGPRAGAALSETVATVT